MSTTTPTAPVAPTHRGRGRFALTTAATAVVVLGAGLSTSAARWPHLPDTVASHWGPDGVDATSGKTAFVVTVSLVLVGLVALLGGIGLALPPDGRRLIAAVTGWVLGFVGVLGFGSLLAQTGVTDPRSATIPPLVLALALALPVGVALGLWRLNPTPPPVTRRPGQPLPAGAATVRVPPDQQVAWFGHASPGRGVTTALVVVLLATSVVTSFLAAPWAGLVPLAISVALVVALHATVVIDQSGVRVTSAGRSWLRVPLDQIRAADHRDLDPLREFGGYGMRYRSDRRGYVVRGGDTLVLRQADATTTYVTLDGAGEAAAVVNTLLSRLP